MLSQMLSIGRDVSLQLYQAASSALSALSALHRLKPTLTINKFSIAGPLFAPDYEPLPNNINFYYEGKKMKLSEEAEEVATFYGRMLDHDYTTKEVGPT